jgi:hypothetical protein
LGIGICVWGSGDCSCRCGDRRGGGEGQVKSLSRGEERED